MAVHYEVQWFAPGGDVLLSRWETLKRENGGGPAVIEDTLRLIKVTTEVIECAGSES